MMIFIAKYFLNYAHGFKMIRLSPKYFVFPVTCDKNSSRSVGKIPFLLKIFCLQYSTAEVGKSSVELLSTFNTTVCIVGIRSYYSTNKHTPHTQCN